MDTLIKQALEGDKAALQAIYPNLGILYLNGVIDSDTFYTLDKKYRIMVDNIMALLN